MKDSPNLQGFIEGWPNFNYLFIDKLDDMFLIILLDFETARTSPDIGKQKDDRECTYLRRSINVGVRKKWIQLITDNCCTVI